MPDPAERLTVAPEAPPSDAPRASTVQSIDPAPPTSFSVLHRHRSIQGIALGSVTTYYYRTTGGAYGNTTDRTAIPAGAVVLGKTTG